MTGRLPIRSGMTTVMFPGQGGELPAGEWTVASMLKEAGYSTCQIGKWHLGEADYSMPTEHGFDEMRNTTLYHLNAYGKPMRGLEARTPSLRVILRPATKVHEKQRPGTNALQSSGRPEDRVYDRDRPLAAVADPVDAQWTHAALGASLTRSAGGCGDAHVRGDPGVDSTIVCSRFRPARSSACRRCARPSWVGGALALAECDRAAARYRPQLGATGLGGLLVCRGSSGVSLASTSMLLARRGRAAWSEWGSRSRWWGGRLGERGCC